MSSSCWRAAARCLCAVSPQTVQRRVQVGRVARKHRKEGRRARLNLPQARDEIILFQVVQLLPPALVRELLRGFVGCLVADCLAIVLALVLGGREGGRGDDDGLVDLAGRLLGLFLGALGALGALVRLGALGGLGRVLPGLLVGGAVRFLVPELAGARYRGRVVLDACLANVHGGGFQREACDGSHAIWREDGTSVVCACPLRR
mmetsp:Transcript_36076/g.84458  ORF Transcript_36076/g.84458 Transcript_36076/m.84458 type:complete len:204 (+) Transcript_36076:714-1325(+)